MKAEWTNSDSLTTSQTTKAILVIEMPYETNINELNRMMKVGDLAVVPCNVLKIKPIPQKLDYASDWEDVETSFRQGWNACLEEITGETE